MSCMINSLVMKPSTTMPSSYGCSIFFPVTKSFSSNPSFSIQIKPIKPHLISCSSLSPFPFSLSAIEKKTRYPSLISFVAKNNNALLEEEEDNLDDQEWENEEEDNLDDQECEEEEEIVSNTEEEWVPSEDCKIFVGNMPYDINSSQLAGLFQDVGIVERAEVIYNKDTDQSRGFGFVSMHTVEEAERAVQMFNGYELNGRLLTVNKAGARGTRPERQSRVFNPTNRIYVGNLPWGVDDAGLTEIFSKHGKVLNARVVRDIESDKSRGFGFVTMSTKSELNDAISNLDGQILNGRPIIVNVAEDRKPRSF